MAPPFLLEDVGLVVGGIIRATGTTSPSSPPTPLAQDSTDRLTPVTGLSSPSADPPQGSSYGNPFGDLDLRIGTRNAEKSTFFSGQREKTRHRIRGKVKAQHRGLLVDCLCNYMQLYLDCVLDQVRESRECCFVLNPPGVTYSVHHFREIASKRILCLTSSLLCARV